jgi:aldose 1-epimerase
MAGLDPAIFLGTHWTVDDRHCARKRMAGSSPAMTIPQMTMVSRPYGKIAGQPVERIEIKNRAGYRMALITYGARLTEFHVPDGKGGAVDVVLGHDTLKGYIDSWACMGATCGRYGNRIRHGELIIGGERHQLPLNWRNHHLHGGPEGFDRRVWRAEAREAEDAVLFTLTSPDGDQGYPGEVEASALYRLEDDGLSIAMEAKTTRPTAINLVHHSYWNLAGHASGSIADHELMIGAERYTPFDDDLMPTAGTAAVAGTPFDLRRPRLLKDCFRALELEGQNDGFDNNWCLDEGRTSLRPVASLRHARSGRRMTVQSTEPGLQVYTCGTFDPATPGKKASRYGPASGAALETQAWPDTPHHPEFPSALLKPEETYRHEMRFTFDQG